MEWRFTPMPTITGFLPNEYGVFESNAVQEVLSYPHSIPVGSQQSIECEIELVQLQNRWFCYGYRFVFGTTAILGGPSADRSEGTFPSREAALTHAKLAWLNFTRHRDRDEVTARRIQAVASWIETVARQRDLFEPACAGSAG